MHLAVLSFFAASGIENVHMATLAMGIVFLPILIFSVFGIGKTIFDEETGLFTVFLLMVYPFVIALSRYFLLEFALLAVVPLVLYLYLKSDNFNQTRYSFLFGVGSGLGMLIKPIFILFVLPVFIYFVISVFLRENESPLKPRTQWRNFVVSLLAIFLVSGWWYLQNSGYLFSTYRMSKIEDVFIDGKVFLPYLALNYFKILASHLSFVLTVVFLFAFYFFIKKEFKQKRFILFWTVTSLVLLMIMRLSDPRYLAPLLPVCALITASVILTIRNLFWKKTIIILLIICGVLGFSYLSLPQKIIKIDLPRKIWWGTYYSTHPRIVDWKINELLSVIKKENSISDLQRTSPVVLLACNHESYNFSTLRYYLEIEQINAALINLAVSPHPVDVLDANRYDLLVYKTAERLLPIARYINFNRGKFTIIYNELLPDKTRLIVYKLIK